MMQIDPRGRDERRLTAHVTEADPAQQLIRVGIVGGSWNWRERDR